VIESALAHCIDEMRQAACIPDVAGHNGAIEIRSKRDPIRANVGD